jgi:hypothetical protein
VGIFTLLNDPAPTILDIKAFGDLLAGIANSAGDDKSGDGHNDAHAEHEVVFDDQEDVDLKVNLPNTEGTKAATSATRPYTVNEGKKNLRGYDDSEFWLRRTRLACRVLIVLAVWKSWVRKRSWATNFNDEPR